MRQRVLFALPLLLLLIVASAFFVLLEQNIARSTQSPIVQLERTLPEFRIDGLARSDIKGPALLHFTASWCAACRVEHPLLMTLSKVLPIYGVAWKDTPAQMKKIHQTAGNPYRKWGVDGGAFGLEMGITGTPESFLISSEGRILAHIKGPLSDNTIDELMRLQ